MPSTRVEVPLGREDQLEFPQKISLGAFRNFNLHNPKKDRNVSCLLSEYETVAKGPHRRMSHIKPLKPGKSRVPSKGEIEGKELFVAAAVGGSHEGLRPPTSYHPLIL